MGRSSPVCIGGGGAEPYNSYLLLLNGSLRRTPCLGVAERRAWHKVAKRRAWLSGRGLARKISLDPGLAGANES